MKRVMILLALVFILSCLEAVPLKMHTIDVVLTPAIHFLKASDTIQYQQALTVADTLYLPSCLKITSVRSQKKKVKYDIQPDSSEYNRIIIQPVTNSSIYSISYEGAIYFALQGRNLNQGHDFSRGMISDAEGEGIFLPAGSWYPIRDKEEAVSFTVKAKCPKEITLITSGKETKRKDDKYNYYEWNTELPTDGLNLCGNRFFVNERYIDGKRLAVYLLPGEKELAKTYLDALQDIYLKYTKLLGEYPFSSFSMVENFFASGFGMPNYTLLAKDIVKMPFIVTAPGSLAHEFCHNWWGNGVYVMPGTGNWCEALTTFCANYYWYELNEDVDKQVEYRRNAVFSVNQLPSEKNYPLSEFHYQRNDDDAVIGYQKGSMFLYELYKYVGKDSFFQALQSFFTQYKGQYATWQDLKGELEKVVIEDAAKDVEKIFQQYLNDTGLPTLRISEVSFQGQRGHVVIEQDEPAFVMKVPVRITTVDGSAMQELIMQGVSASFPLFSKDNLVKLEIDPDYELLRAVSKDEMPYNMNRVMSDNPLLILPSKGESVGRLQMLIMMLKQSGYQFTSLPADSVNEDNLKNRSHVVFGSYEDNDVMKKLSSSLPKDFSFDKSHIQANGKMYTGARASLLLSCSSPFNKAKMMTVYVWNGEEAVPSFRKMFHYQNQSWQVFDLDREANKPIESGDFYPTAKTGLVWKSTNN